MQRSGPLVVGLGEFLWDMLPSGKRPGGAPANFAAIVGQLGANGIVASAVGKDAPGDELIQWIRDVGLRSDLIQITPYPTSLVSVEVDAGGHAKYLIHENVAWDHLEWTPEIQELASRAACVCLGSLAQRSPTSRAMIQRFLQTTSPDCLRIFDVNLRQHYYSRDVVESTLSAADVFKLSEDEWPIIARLLEARADETSGMQQLIERWNLRLIALTRGGKGSTLITPSQTLHLPAQPVRVVDTVGAGDSFTATLAMGLLNGRPLEQIHAHATAVSGYVCTQPGATPRLPSHLLNWNGS
jgi:fructokinase